MKEEYYATISRNFRDVATGDPKVLLRDVNTADNKFRDHCWISQSEVKDFIPYKNHQHLRICFEAKTKEYLGGKITLKQVENARIVRKQKQ